MKAAPALADLSLQTLLVPTDFSGPAEKALLCAEQLARATGAKIVLAHVFDDSDYMIGVALGLGGDMGPVAENRARAHRLAEQRLATLTAASRARGAQIEERLVDGPPAPQITQLAGEVSADLVVLSTHGRTGWRRLVMGSVAEQVVRYAPCPVLAVHAHDDAVAPAADATGLAAAPLQLRRILAATDFSAPAAVALPWAECLAMSAGASLSVLHVVAPTKIPVETSGEALPLLGPGDEVIYQAIREGLSNQLDQLCAGLRERGLAAECQLLSGAPAEKICNFSGTLRTDLIVLGTQGTTSWQRALLGTTAERVIRSAACPVLVVRPKGGEPAST